MKCDCNGKCKECKCKTMKNEEFIREHKRLVKILRGGKVKEQLEEAEEQAKELKRFCKKEGLDDTDI